MESIETRSIWECKIFMNGTILQFLQPFVNKFIYPQQFATICENILMQTQAKRNSFMFTMRVQNVANSIHHINPIRDLCPMPKLKQNIHTS